MLTLKKHVTLPAAGLSGFETPLADEEAAIQAVMHRFARDVMRPLGVELDRLTAEQVIAPGSPYYGIFAEYAKLGLDPAMLAEMPSEMAVRTESLIGEELGWGDAGLGVSLAVAAFPQQMAAVIGHQELVDLCAGRIGCWMITHPNKGSDVTMLDVRAEWPAGQPANKGNMWGRLRGDEIVVNGQCSAWVSNGAVAQVALGYIGAEYAGSFYDRDGNPNGMSLIIPLDLPGVSKGRPLDKIGQRALPQGEIYFDDVRVPKRFAIALGDDYYGNMASAWSYAGTNMAQLFTGVARSAFDVALRYCHERKQGGKPLIEHQLTRHRIGDMLRRVELCRAVARRSLAFARLSPATHPYVTAAGKVTVTQEAMNVVDAAFQLFGGAGTSREYPIEKIFRDARVALIEDGENTILTSRLGILAQQLYAEGWSQD
jgi:acyl-CoA dehydrogenase